eukprot:5764479-Karenia_brevis.AAC.1
MDEVGNILAKIPKPSSQDEFMKALNTAETSVSKLTNHQQDLQRQRGVLEKLMKRGVGCVYA